MNDSSRHVDWLRRRYADSLTGKQKTLAKTWATCCAKPADAAVRADLQQQLHRLCGSAHAYGYAQLGDDACRADSLLRSWETATTTLRDAPAALIERLRAPVAAVLADLVEGGPQELDDAPVAMATALRVLLVEDDVGQSAFICAELEACGCEVRREDSADLVWQRLTLWPCDAVVVDYWLRGETAVDVVAALRREPRFARLALVCFSVERDAQVLRAVLDAGCDATVAKSEGSGRLFEVVRDCVARTDRGGAR
ncbi:MAG: response regulator [Dokdonella sp.]|uniref:response regulator n=1 Tax=Dokdonella sp. TaxID=2291710 RepID=UPI003263357B